MKHARMTPIGALVAAMVIAPVNAQTDNADPPQSPEAVEQMFNCRSVEQPLERLACFDRTVQTVFDARASRDIVIADREQVTEARRGVFGLKLPTMRLFGGGDDDEEINEITSTLAGAERMRNGLYIFELEDGARWMQTEDAAGYQRYEAGDTIIIERAALGSFKAKVNGRRAVRVRRLN